MLLILMNYRDSPKHQEVIDFFMPRGTEIVNIQIEGTNKYNIKKHYK